MPPQTKRTTIGFDETKDCFDLVGQHEMALRRYQKTVEQGISDSELHKRARRARKKEEERRGQVDHPPNNQPPDEPPPEQPPPVRDKYLGGERKLSRGTDRAPHETEYIAGPPRIKARPIRKEATSPGQAKWTSEGETPNTTQGKPMSLMQPQPLANLHPFTPVLHDWKHGIEVDCGPEWKEEVIEAAVVRGPHPSALTPQAIELFAEDIGYQERAGFCKVVTWEELKLTHPKNLKISPVAVVPQVGRRGRIILDLSFPVYQDVEGVMTITQDSVNETTVITAPTTPVKEIGKVLQRLLHFMKMIRAGRWIYFSKLDISDGFWRLIVRPEDSFNFAYVLPQPPGQPIRIVIPSAVQMGWVESPSYFCTVTECARDITQYLVDNNTSLPPHPIEEQMHIPDVPPRARSSSPTSSLQVYVDDFCTAATQSTDGKYLAQIRRASVQGIHAVFPETTITNHANGKEPISRTKLEKGDGNFETTKIMIGFEFDGIKRTVRLPETKAKLYIKEAHTMLRRRSIPLKTLQTTVGKLRHAAAILPATKGFFTPLNNIMTAATKSIVLNEDARAAILDICTLIHQLCKRPTHVNELIPDPPSHVAYHDAAAEGAGGVWFSLEEDKQPAVWRTPFPPDIANNVISDDNPTGSITNSDLELAAEVFAIGIILERATTIKHKTVGTLCDNSPTVSWIERMASKSIFPTAGRLLRGLAYMLHNVHAGGVITVHVKGTDNIMADLASRPTKAMATFAPAHTSLTDSDFCSSFNTAFPLPNDQDWILATVPEWLKFNVFETLRGKRLELRQWAAPRELDIGKHGRTTVGSTKQAAQASHPPTQPTCSSLLLLPCGKVSTASEIKSRFSQSPKLSEPLAKSMFWTDITTHDDPPQPNKHLISQ